MLESILTVLICKTFKSFKKISIVFTVCKEDLGSETEQNVNQKYKSEENK